MIKRKKLSRTGDKEATITHKLLGNVRDALDEFIPVRSQELDEATGELLRPLNLLTAKPVLYIANVDDANPEGNEYSATVAEHAQKGGC